MIQRVCNKVSNTREDEQKYNKNFFFLISFYKKEEQEKYAFKLFSPLLRICAKAFSSLTYYYHFKPLKCKR